MRIAGIDIGTTACKLSLYEADGTLLREEEREYPPRGAAGPFEIDLGAVWDTLAGLLGRMAPDMDGLKAVGVTSFGETAALLDGEDRLLGPSILYMDPRGAKEAEEMAGALGADTIAAVTGLTPGSMYTLPKLLWVRRHQPELFSRARKILLVQDYIVYRLTGTRQIDHSLASRTMAFDVRKRRFSREILDHAGLDPELFSAPVPSGTVAGPVRDSLARELRLPSGILVVSAAHDQIAACLGAGVLAPGEAVNSSGTVECITPVYRGFPDPARMQKGQYPVVPFPGEDSYATYAFSYTGGALLKWFRDQVRESPDDGDFYRRMDARIGGDPSGLLVLPHFAGAGTPYMDSAALGAVAGLNLKHGAADLYRGLMEGVAYEMRLNLEVLSDAGIRVSRLYAAGGGARSAAWLQMKADILNLPIVSLGTAQCGTLGCIMLAGVACGAYRDLEQAARALVRPGSQTLPDAARHERYMQEYGRYRRLHDALRPLWA